MKALTIASLSLLVSAAIGLTLPIHAEDEVQVGRYSSVRSLPTEEQKDVFQTITTIEFPSEIKTVGDAIRHSLKNQGFRLAAPKSVDKKMKILLELPLPNVHRELGPMPLKSVLETLAGPVWRLVHDPVHRLVGFELCEVDDSEEARE